MSEEHIIACVAPQVADLVLPHVRKFLKPAYKIGGGIGYNEAALLEDIKGKFVQLWICYRTNSIDAAMLTRLVNTEDGLSCQISALGGRDMLQWRKLWPQVEAYAKAEGCCKVRIEGRLGWRRVLADYVQTGVILEKRMT